MSDTLRVRLFFALPADEASGLLRPVHERLAAFPRLLKTVSPEHYHITLKFLGETDEGTCARIREEFRAYRPGTGAVPYALKGLGCFPNSRRPRVIWCGLETDHGILTLIQGAIEEISSHFGFTREDRAFTPHLTLARTRGEGRLPGELAKLLAENAATAYGESRLCRIVLFKSVLGRGGPVYTALEELRLP
jgi:RNA 2',3'-cyclic 3'-phosphodiesterase